MTKRYLVTGMRKAFQHAVFTFVVEADSMYEANKEASERISRVTLHEVTKVMVERIDD